MATFLKPDRPSGWQNQVYNGRERPTESGEDVPETSRRGAHTDKLIHCILRLRRVWPRGHGPHGPRRAPCHDPALLGLAHGRQQPRPELVREQDARHRRHLRLQVRDRPCSPTVSMLTSFDFPAASSVEPPRASRRPRASTARTRVQTQLRPSRAPPREIRPTHSSATRPRTASPQPSTRTATMTRRRAASPRQPSRSPRLALA